MTDTCPHCRRPKATDLDDANEHHASKCGRLVVGFVELRCEAIASARIDDYERAWIASGVDSTVRGLVSLEEVVQAQRDHTRAASEKLSELEYELRNVRRERDELRAIRQALHYDADRMQGERDRRPDITIYDCAEFCASGTWPENARRAITRHARRARLPK